jgi:thioredoxin-related protein
MKFWIVLLISFYSSVAIGQVDTLQAPYKRFPTLPPIQLLLGDSTSKFTKDALPKDKPVMVMLFSPDCSHCQHTAEELLKYREALKDIQIVMATMHSLSDMNAFVSKYRLRELPNLTIGKDIYYLLAPFYAVRNLPYMAFYNAKGDLLSTFEGGLPIPKVVELFNKTK